MLIKIQVNGEIFIASAHPESGHFEILVKNQARPDLFLVINQEA
jgi:hypothetical protein